MASNYTHRNLIVWQKAQELAHQVIQLSQRLPSTWANAVIARQIIRSATSVGANIAEGHGRYTPAAHRNHLLIARGSLAETDSWLDMLRREGYLKPAEETPLLNACVEINAILTSKVLMLDRLLGESGSALHESRALYESTRPETEPPFPFSPADYITE